MTTVCITKSETYDKEAALENFRELFDRLGCGGDFFGGKNVVIKPNFVRKMDPQAGGTTHPSFIYAAALAAAERGAKSVTVAESPSGPYNETALHSIYKGCMTADAVSELEKNAVKLNYDCSAVHLDYKEGIAVRNFNIIKPIADADVIINLSKLKTHGLTTMSAAVKNLFGSIPGTEKLEMHARFPNVDDFCEMLVDLCAMHYSRAKMINIVDAIVAMEGNGPTNGKPRKLGLVIAGMNPFAVDSVCADIIMYGKSVPTVAISRERKLFDRDDISISGESPEKVRVTDFVPPDSRKGLVRYLSNTRIMKLFEPRPQINTKRCVCCGECMRSCPKKTITLDTVKKRAVIHPENCIKCFCCQELCPHDAVKIKRSFIVSSIK